MVEPTPFTYISGYANRFKEMLKYLHKAGDEVHVLTPDHGPGAPTQTVEGYKITPLRGFQFPLYNRVTFSFDLAGVTGRVIPQFKPDLIHVSTPSLLVFPAVYWSWRYNIPLVMSYHVRFPQYAAAYVPFPGSVAMATFLMRTFHGVANLVLCTSPQLKDDLESENIKNVDIWQKGIDTERFSPKFREASMRDRLSEGHPEDPLLLYVGRLGREKRLERLAQVLDASPGARLALVGDGPSEEELRTFFKGYPNVHFVGILTGDELSSAFASCDVFVMPSDTETLGFVVLEAMASGVPVVGVASGGVMDIIQPDTGFLASNTDNMVEFSARVSQLISNASLRQTLGEAGRRWALGWNWEAATIKLREQYHSALARQYKGQEKGSETASSSVRPNPQHHDQKPHPDLS